MVCAGGGRLDIDDIYVLNTDTILSKTTSTRIYCSSLKKRCQESVDEPAIFAYHPFIRMSFVQRGQARPGQTGLRRRKKGLSEKQNKTPLAEKKTNTITIGMTGERRVEGGEKGRGLTHRERQVRPGPVDGYQRGQP